MGAIVVLLNITWLPHGEVEFRIRESNNSQRGVHIVKSLILMETLEDTTQSRMQECGELDLHSHKTVRIQPMRGRHILTNLSVLVHSISVPTLTVNHIQTDGKCHLDDWISDGYIPSD